MIRKINEARKEEKTCIDKAVMKMKTEQGSSHTVVFGNCSDHHGSDDREGLRAC